MTDILLTGPVTLYGSNISYFTGKMENYFRLRSVPYELRSMQFPAFKKRMEKVVGLVQMPAVVLPDGRWMTDTTSMIDWFERQLPGRGLMPLDPIQRFLCLLLEDWADEWWWRPAMHYRWHYAEGARYASWHLAEELLGAVPAPIGLKRWYFQQRQRSGYTTGDGMSVKNVGAVEAAVSRLFAQLQSIFSTRPFFLGSRPSLADIGFSGPFFRHFALDPVPLEIIRQQAPAVLEWVARLWNTRMSDCTGVWSEGVPADVAVLLDDIGSGYLPYLCANAEAVQGGRKRFDIRVDGVSYSGARSSRYRVWCLQQLRCHFMSMSETARKEGRSLLEAHGCWEPLWRHESLPLLPGQEGELPFRAHNKMLAVNE